MANLSRAIVRAAPQLAVQNNSTADAGSQSQADNCPTSASRAAPQFAKRRSIRVVFEDHRRMQRTRQSFNHVEPIETWNVRNFDCATGTDCSRNHNGKRLDRMARGISVVLALGRGGYNRLDHLTGRIRRWRGLFYSRVDVSALVNGRRTLIRLCRCAAISIACVL